MNTLSLLIIRTEWCCSFNEIDIYYSNFILKWWACVCDPRSLIKATFHFALLCVSFCLCKLSYIALYPSSKCGAALLNDMRKSFMYSSWERGLQYLHGTWLSCCLLYNVYLCYCVCVGWWGVSVYCTLYPAEITALLFCNIKEL